MDWTTVAIRFALYLDLTLLFGLPFFVLHSLRKEELSSVITKRVATVVSLMTIWGLVLSLLNLLVMAKTMTGVEKFNELEQSTFSTLITSTNFGIAWLVRISALGLILMTPKLGVPARIRFVLMASLAGVALATLAWSGHAVMADGLRRLMQVGNDIAHMIAAGAWIGAIAALAVLAKQSLHADSNTVALLSQASTGFARIGTLIVATLCVTGAINYGLIAGFSLPPLSPDSYGGLLLIKLTLFAGMLGLAAINRFRLSPQLKVALARDQHRDAVQALMSSLKFEACLAIVILALVAYLGVQSPH